MTNGQGNHSNKGWGTPAGVLAFVVGGLGTIVAAIGDFGSDDGALAAARRNHTSLLILAAALAAVGLFCGGLYTILRNHKPTEAHAVWALLVGVIAVAAGVAIGATATTDREPGRPKISVERVDDSSVVVRVSAEGLPSDAWYEAEIHGYADEPGDAVDLVATAFSPGQDGKLDWSARVYAGKHEETEIARIVVRVARGGRNLERGDPVDCTKGFVTCLAVRIPTTGAPSTGAGE